MFAQRKSFNEAYEAMRKAMCILSDASEELDDHPIMHKRLKEAWEAVYRIRGEMEVEFAKSIPPEKRRLSEQLVAELND